MFLQAALMILIPLYLWSWAARRFGLGRHGWAVIGFGCLFFMLSQFVNAPLRIGAVALGAGEGARQLVAFSLIAGLGEECARYVAMRYVGQIRERLDRATAIVYGLGHGGFESLLLGLGVLATAFVIRNASDPAQLAQMPPAMVQQAQTVLATPWYVFLAGVVERILAITLHVGLSLIVYRAVRDKVLWPLGLAIVWHAVANGGALALQSTLGNALVTELWVAIAAAAALYYGVGTREPSAARAAPEPSVAAAPEVAAGSGRS
jgi:uncharacterized membrane protein YhfC